MVLVKKVQKFSLQKSNLRLKNNCNMTDSNLNLNPKRVAIVHDYMFQFGGAEKVIEHFFKLFPTADFYTSFSTPEHFKSSKELLPILTGNRIKTTWAQKIFDIKIHKGKVNERRLFDRYQKHLFWLYPILMRFLVVKDYDLVIISSTDCGKQITLKNNKRVVHYCNSPSRYLNGLVTGANHNKLPFVYRIFIPFFVFWLKKLDQNSVKRLASANTEWIGNSNFIRTVIKQVYGVDSIVLYPPMDLTSFFKIKRKSSEIEDFYLSLGRISFHKRLDLMIESCLLLGRKLKIAGTSARPDEIDALKLIVEKAVKCDPSKSGLIHFLGRVSDEEYTELVRTAKCFLFPGKEDFGITPIEILASGVPIVAFGQGGALEYVRPGINGVLFESQTVDCLCNAILEFEKSTFDPETIQKSVQNFTTVDLDRFLGAIE